MKNEFLFAPVSIICIMLLIILNNKHRVYKNSYWSGYRKFFELRYKLSH